MCYMEAQESMMFLGHYKDSGYDWSQGSMGEGLEKGPCVLNQSLNFILATGKSSKEY